MTKKGYNYPIKIKIALASIIQLVWQDNYTILVRKSKGVNKKVFPFFYNYHICASTQKRKTGFQQS